MDILFYYYYLFYKKGDAETQPVATTVFVLSLLITWDIFIPLVLLSIVFLHSDIFKKIWIYIGLFVCVAFVMYMHYIKSKKYLKVIKQKPMLCNNNSLSIVFAIGFGILSFLILTLGIIWGKELYQNYCVSPF